MKNVQGKGTFNKQLERMDPARRSRSRGRSSSSNTINININNINIILIIMANICSNSFHSYLPGTIYFHELIKFLQQPYRVESIFITIL